MKHALAALLLALIGAPVANVDSLLPVGESGADVPQIEAWGWQIFTEDVPSDGNYLQIEAGRDHSIALRTDGSIVGWPGVLPDGPPEVVQAPPGSDFVKIQAGDNCSFALRSDGSIAAWGLDNWGIVTNAPTGTGFVDIACTDELAIPSTRLLSLKGRTTSHFASSRLLSPKSS